MSQEVGSILVLAAVFAIGSLRPINMGPARPWTGWCTRRSARCAVAWR
jgi:hypothetical protein